MWVFWQLFDWTWANWTIFFFSYRKSQTRLCKLFLHVSQQNSINVCTSTKERSLFVVLVLRSTWFRYILSEAVQSNRFHQITCTLSWFPGALYCTCVLCRWHSFLLVADRMPCLECFFSFFPLSLKPTHASRWKEDLYLNGLHSPVLGLPHPRTPVVSIKAGIAATAFFRPEYQWP